MKSKITEAERKDIEERIRAGQPGLTFEHPWPELFMGADGGRPMIVYDTPPTLCPFYRHVEMKVVLTANAAGEPPHLLLVLARFRLN